MMWLIYMFGENMCNVSVNQLLPFMNEVESELMICNGRKLVVSEPEWTRVRPSLKQKSIIDYIIKDAQLLKVSGNVHVDDMVYTDIRSPDHFLVRMELGWTSQTKEEKVYD